MSHPWAGGIPNFLGPYTYFRTLNDASNYRKKRLFNMAQGMALSNLNTLTLETQKFQRANQFINQVATSERDKELALIQAYCQEMGTDFPSLQTFLKNPETMYENPEKFYTALTEAINKIRLGTTDYLRELKRIKKNLNNQTKRTIQSYRADDYRYKLVNDMTSFMAHLTGNENWIKEQLPNTYNDSTYTLKVQNIVMNILNNTGVLNKITSGEDFAAIAANVLVDVEKRVQEEIDNDPNQYRSIDLVSDSVLQKIETEYLKQLRSKKATTSPVQRALLDIDGIDFTRITQNAKELLGISTMTFPSKAQLTHQLKQIDKYEKENTNEQIQHIREKIHSNKALHKDLKLTTFSISGSYNTKHGSINELVNSIIGTNVIGNVGTDIISYKISWKTETNIKNFDILTKEMGNTFSSVLDDTKSEPANLRDVQTLVENMNNEIDNLIEQAEKQLAKSKQFKNQDLFVFHDSLKLYSSAETGNSGHSGFGGRQMNIMSYIGYLAAANSAGIQGNPINQKMLGFLARNLVPGAIADNCKDVLEQYFSTYAGLLMFDDVVNMANEAVSKINQEQSTIGGKVRQIHLYNLNGIYVPASMILFYTSNKLNEASPSIIEDFAQATITTKSVSYDSSGPLTVSTWESVANAAISATQVKITILQAFGAFINSLGL